MHRKCLRWFLNVALIPLVSITHVSAICNGAAVGLGDVQRLSNGSARWPFFDNSCNMLSFVDLTPAQNPCTSGVFSCSSAPIQFTSYINQTDGSKYTCKRENTTIPESCNSIAIDSCCIKANVDSSTPSTSSSSSRSSSSFTLPTFPPSTFGTPSQSSFPGNSGGTKRSNAGVIAGGIIGGLAVLIILILTLVILTRRRRAAKEERFYNYAPGISAYFIPYEVATAATQQSEPPKSWPSQNPRGMVPTRSGFGDGSIKREDGQTGSLRDSVRRTQTEDSRTMGVSPVENVAPDVAEQLRGEVQNIRREMEEMEMRTRFGPPPVYHSEMGDI